ncbi:MAG: serine hydrolase domain-containing protein [Bacteroidota bacterium]
MQDSILVKGQLVWKDQSIIGYPAQVKITPLSNPEVIIMQKVDSIGRFEQLLPKGTYTFAPQLNYHWMEEDWIRIDAQKSTQQLKVKARGKNQITIQLDTIAWPAKPRRTRILKSAAALNPQAIDAFIQDRMAFFEIPGATLSIIDRDRIIYNQVYGVTNAETKQAVNHQTLFEAGSITKIVFAFAVMRLYERREIDLDKPLYEYFEHQEIDDDRYKLITARYVLSHQTGMANWPRKDENGQFKLKFTPGTKYGYSGKAYEYLKEVVEKITAKPIEVILQEEVLKPLNIKDMYFKGSDIIATRGAHGHKKYVPSDIFLAKRTMVAYTLQTTSEAIAKFAIAMRQRKGLKQETYDEMFKVHAERSDGTKWGLGVRIEDTPEGISYGHSGSTGRGFISNLVFYDEIGLGYTVLTNCQMGGWLSLPLLNEYLITGQSDYGN